jgi:hypothetical protein
MEQHLAAAARTLCPKDVIVFQVRRDARDMSAFVSTSLQPRIGIPSLNHYHILFGLSVIVLSSTFRCNPSFARQVTAKSDDAQSQQRYGLRDQVWRDLEYLSSMALTQDSLAVIRKHYQMVSTEHGTATMRKKLVKPSEALPWLPDFLYVDEASMEKLYPTRR